MRLPREQIILENRRQEELRDEATAMVEYNKQFDLKVLEPISHYVLYLIYYRQNGNRLQIK